MAHTFDITNSLAVSILLSQSQLKSLEMSKEIDCYGITHVCFRIPCWLFLLFRVSLLQMILVHGLFHGVYHDDEMGPLLNRIRPLYMRLFAKLTHQATNNRQKWTKSLDFSCSPENFITDTYNLNFSSTFIFWRFDFIFVSLSAVCTGLECFLNWFVHMPFNCIYTFLAISIDPAKTQPVKFHNHLPLFTFCCFPKISSSALVNTIEIEMRLIPFGENKKEKLQQHRCIEG